MGKFKGISSGSRIDWRVGSGWLVLYVLLECVSEPTRPDMNILQALQSNQIYVGKLSVDS